MFPFKHDHYVPVLRWKRAERVGLGKLAGSVRSQVTPLVELVPIADNTPGKVADEIKKSWGFDYFFLDFVNLPDAESSDIIADVSDCLHLQGIRPILVTGLTRGLRYQTAVAKAVTADKRGACIRLYPDDLKSEWLKIHIADALQGLGLEPERVDLVVDYQLISDFAMPFQELCKKLPHLTRWRTFTVLSGAFSKDLREYKKNAEYTRSREDWLFWLAHENTRLERRPTYGDYGIQYALYKEPPARSNPSASIRYTSDDYWVIMRGEGLFNDGGPGNAQYGANALLLSEREEFCGRSFSYGDQYIDDLGRGFGTGTPETLLRAGTNHHITFVTDQLSKSVSTSIGDVPFLGQYPNQQSPRAERRSTRAAYDARDQLRQTRPIK
jgi:hypothetical protein